MMLGYFLDNSEQFVASPKRNKFSPPRGFHVDGGSWKLSGSSNFCATCSFRRQAHNAPNKPQQPRKHTPPNRKPEATSQGGNILTISAFYLIGGIAPGVGGAVCFVDATASCPIFTKTDASRSHDFICRHFGLWPFSVDAMCSAGGGGDGRTKR